MNGFDFRNSPLVNPNFKFSLLKPPTNIHKIQAIESQWRFVLIIRYVDLHIDPFAQQNKEWDHTSRKGDVKQSSLKEGHLISLVFLLPLGGFEQMNDPE